MKVILPTALFSDERGYFGIEFRKDDFKKLGLPTEFVQSNYSHSAPHVIRGLHFQSNPPMGKLMRVTSGEAFLVTVDLRPESKTFLQWMGIWSKAGDGIQVWAPERFARGFYARQETEVRYMCTGYFDAAGDDVIAWNDLDIGVDWPIEFPILSERDRKAKTLRERGLL